jgi:hypothetical protein
MSPCSFARSSSSPLGVSRVGRAGTGAGCEGRGDRGVAAPVDGSAAASGGTLVRWHQELVRRRWTYHARPSSRRGLAPEVVEFVVGWPRRTDAGVTCGSSASARRSGWPCENPPRLDSWCPTRPTWHALSALGNPAWATEQRIGQSLFGHPIACDGAGRCEPTDPPSSTPSLVTVVVCGVSYRGVTPQLGQLIRSGVAESGGGTRDGRGCGR